MDRHALTVARVLRSLDLDEAAEVAAALVDDALEHGVSPDSWVGAWVVLYGAGIHSEDAMHACLAFSRTFRTSVIAVAQAMRGALVADYTGAGELSLSFVLEGHQIRCSLGVVSVLVERSPAGIVSAFAALAGYLGRVEASA